MSTRLPALLRALSWGAIFCAAFAQADAPTTHRVTPIALHYYERKPFHYTAPDGRVMGLVVTPTEQAFAEAGLPIKWVLTPANRILFELERNATADCTPGWYRKPDREAYARFSSPIYRDRPLVGLARSDTRFPQGITARQLLGRPDTKLLVKTNFSQGAYMDALIAKMPAGQVDASPGEVSSLVKMVNAGRADLIITTQEEVELYVNQAELKMKDFRVLVFPDVPAVEMRYILCSKLVPAEVITRLNKAIAEKVRLPP